MDTLESRRATLAALAAQQPYAQQAMFVVFMPQHMLTTYSDKKDMRFMLKNAETRIQSDENDNRVLGFHADGRGLQALQIAAYYMGHSHDQHIKTPHGYEPLTDNLKETLAIQQKGSHPADSGHHREWLAADFKMNYLMHYSKQHDRAALIASPEFRCVH